MSYTLPEPQSCAEHHGIEYPAYTAEQMQAAFDAGRASRDAEVEALQARVAELTSVAEHGEIREQKIKKEFERVCGERGAALAKLKELEAQARNRVPEAWTNLLAYVLQGDMQNRLTPRVIDIAYSAFALAKQPNTENGEASDWFNDTKPSVENLIAKLRKDLVEELEAQPSPTALELMREYSNGKQWALQQAQPEPAELTDEQDRALCEAYCNAHSDEYFKARPQLDSEVNSKVNRRIFYAGYRKAWVTVAAAKGGDK